MMPGARKLELGFKEMGGWLTLKHNHSDLTRCWHCLRRDQRKLYLNADK